MDSNPHRFWRLLPSEQVLWQGGPTSGVSRDRRWMLIPVLFGSFAVVVALFAGLLAIADLPGTRSMAFLAFYLLCTAIAVRAWPRFYLDPCEYMVTDRHVISRRGSVRNAIECRAITYGRIHWNRSDPGVGHLELVRAVPFGPLARKQRLVLHNVEAPDRLFALIRRAQPSAHAGYADVALTDRLDEGESVLWGGGPAGMRMGAAEGLTAVWGFLALCAGALYVYRTGAILRGLESIGLPVRSVTWGLLFLAIVISGTVMLGVGASLLFRGTLGARAEGSATEYVLTQSRLLIRRGRTELSVDRSRIVDVAHVRRGAGLGNLVLILDGPNGRALDDNGALSMFSAPARSIVPPVLYEVQDPQYVCGLLLEHKTQPYAA